MSWPPLQCPAPLAASGFLSKSQETEGSRGRKGASRVSEAETLWMPEPQLLCHGPAFLGGSKGNLQLPPNVPFLNLQQHKTSQFIVFLDINIDSRWC